MNDQVQPSGETSVMGGQDLSQLSDLTMGEAANLMAQRRSALPQVEEAPTDEQAEGVQISDDDQLETESSNLESQDEATEETDADTESLADSETDQPDDAEVYADDDVFDLGEGETITRKEIRDARESGMRQADYQRKTQVLAQTTQAVTGLQEQLNAFAHAQMRIHQAKVAQVTEALQQYANTDWVRLSQEKPAEYATHQAQFNQLKETAQRGRQDFQRFQQEFGQLSQQVITEKAKAAQPELLQRMKGWNEAQYHTLRESVIRDYGGDEAQVNRITDPWFWEIVNDAHTYRTGKTMKTGQNKIRRASATPKASAPTTKVDPSVKQDADGVDKIRKADTTRGQMEVAMDLMRSRRANKRRA